MGELYKYWPKQKPLPDGWIMVDELAGTNHGRYAVLIKWVGI